MSRLWQYRYIIILSIIVVLLIVFALQATSGERNAISPLEKAVGKLLNPVRNLLTRSVGAVGDTFQVAGELRKIRAQNAVLQQKVGNYDTIKNHMLELEAENRSLRQMLALRDNNDQYNLLAAEITGRSPSNWTGIITVNKGARDGITKDMAVVSGNMELVGRVVTVAEDYSTILPILDQRSAVGARVQRSRQEGIVKGVLTQTDYCQFTRLSREADVKKGDLIITSGIGGVYPKGIVIGKVMSIDRSGISVTATVKPSVSLSKIEQVFIIKRVLREEPDLPPMGGEQ